MPAGNSRSFDRFERYSAALSSTLYPLQVDRVGEVAPFAGAVATGQLGEVLLMELSCNATFSYSFDPPSVTRSGGMFLKYQVAGSTSYSHGGRAMRCRSGSIGLFREGHAIEGAQHAAGSAIIAALPSAMVREELAWLPAVAGAVVSDTSGATELLRNLLLGLCAAARGSASALNERSAPITILPKLLELAFSGEQRHIAGARRLDQVRAVMREVIGCEGMSIGLICRRLGLSRSSLYAITHSAGTTPERLIYELRLEAARRRLRDPAWATADIGAIAYSLGFQSLPHFSRRFRAAYGTSPSSYRKS